MCKWLARALVASFVITSGWVFLDTRCPLYVDGPSYPVHRIQQDLAVLETSAGIFRVKYGRDPQSIGEIVESGVLRRIPRDRYDNEYAFRPDRIPRFHSIGRNHRDEGGHGDDIVEKGEYSCPEFYRCPTACEWANHLLLAFVALGWPGILALLVAALAREVWSRLKRPLEKADTPG